MMIGTTISHYRILEKLGEGGMGVVYKAHDTRLDRTVALKFLPPAGGEKEKARLIREARAVAQLDHPNICTVYEIGDSEGVPYIAMAYIEGETLKARVENGPLALNEIIDYTRQIARGLQSAHRKHITHRDIKSANIMITPDGQIKIMDFGLAKLAGRTQLTQEGSTAGTVMYMSPEQARGEDVDHRTDIWSFGVVLYEMLTGRLPFQSEYETAAVYSILNENPPSIGGYNPDAPPELEAIVMRMLQKNKEDRYQQLDEFFSDLDVFSGTAVLGNDWRRVFTGRKRFLYAAAVFVLLLVIVAVFFLGSPVPEVQAIESIAVLPFTNLSNDPDQDYFSDGMMEEILDRLFKIGDLKVISRTSSMRYKNTDKTIKEIAGELGVASILEGSVRRMGNNVRITVQLIDAGTDAHLWSEIYDGDLSDLSRIFFIQSEVAQSVARELKAVLSPQEVKLIEKTPTTDLIAYENFLKGKFAVYKYNAEDLSLGMQYFEKALERDPDFALAYAGIAYVWLFRQQGGIATPDEAVPKIMEAVEKALELDNSLAEVHFMQANLNVLGLWEWEAAESAYKKAIEINPNHAEAHGLYAQLLFITGKRKEAMQHNELSIKLDPVNPVIQMWYSCVLFWDGRYDECIDWSSEVVERNLFLEGIISMAFHMKGQYDEAFEWMKKEISNWGIRNFDHVFDQYEKLGYAGTMNLLADALFALSKTEWFSPATIAMFYCYAGNKERALDCLELAYEMRDVHVIYSGSYPYLAIIHEEPRYQKIMSKMNLPINKIESSEP
jgi:eukaryotic-like serine/threonine-protein kinase